VKMEAIYATAKRASTATRTSLVDAKVSATTPF
jgi:hypothetical protein